MPEPLDEAQVRHVAKLARLNLSDDEVRLFRGQLGRILEYVRQLEQVNTEGVAPLAHPLPVTNVLRDDQPHQPMTTDVALANAPDRAGDFFKVPSVLERAGEA
jgi:aspartyl-tRNA(Asn)/glutamyl-tRNA(Gln) amidotransferase subunit C